MTSFTEQALVAKLLHLSPTQQSIQTLSLWLIHHRKRSKQIVEIWFKELRKLRVPPKLTTFLFLANDVLQNCKRKGSEFTIEFNSVLENAFAHIASCSDVKLAASVRRVLEIWRERQVYDAATIERFTLAITSNLSSEALAEFQKAPKPRSQSSSGSDASPHMPAQTPPAPDSDEEAKSPVVKKRKSISRPITSSSPPPDTAALITAIKELDNAASADVFVREKIAALPPEIADVKNLEKIKSVEEAMRYQADVSNADRLLTEYNRRLHDELHHRKSMLKSLRSYLNHFQLRTEEDERSLAQWRDKLAKLTKHRQELKAHVESLPDLSRLPCAPPLPSAGELFTK